MEYDFHKNIYGVYEAKLSMGHEAFGAWINDNLTTGSRCEQILLAVSSSRQKSQTIQSSCGHYSLILQPNEISIECHALSDNSSFDDGALDYYDDELTAHCGPEDFVGLVIAWQEFIEGSHPQLNA